MNNVEIKDAQIKYTSGVMAKLNAQLSDLNSKEGLTPAEINKRDVLVRLVANRAAMLKDIRG